MAVTDSAELARWASQHARGVRLPLAPVLADGDAAGWPGSPIALESLVLHHERALVGHSGGNVRGAALVARPDGRLLLATGSIDGTARIWEVDTGTVLHTLTGHNDEVIAVAWTVLPDGRAVLATGGKDHTIRIWDADTGTCLQTLTSHTSPVISVAWARSSEGRALLASGSSDRSARIWDGESGTCLRAIAHEELVYAAGWTQDRDGRALPITGSFGGRPQSRGIHAARIWDPDTGSCLQTFRGHTEAVRSVASVRLPDGRRLMGTGSFDNTARIWDVDTGTCLHTLAGHTAAIHAVAWTQLPDGRPLLATASTDNSVRFWDAETGRCLQTVDHQVQVKAVDLGWDRHGRLLLATGADNHRVDLWATEPIASLTVSDPLPPAVDPADLAFRQARTLSGHDGWIWRLALTDGPDGRLLLATAGYDRTARIWDPDAGTCLHTLTDHADTLIGVAWTRLPDGGPQLATAGYDGTVRIWDPDAGTCLRTVTLTGHTERVYDVAWIRQTDGRALVATGSDENVARIWDSDSGACVQILTGHTRDVYAVAHARSPDGRMLLATGSADSTVRIWHVESGACLRILAGHTDAVMGVAWAPPTGGRALVATGSNDDTVRIWDAETGACLHILTGHTSDIISVAWTLLRGTRPLLASGSRDQTVRIWDPDTGTCLHTLTCGAAVHGVDLREDHEGRLVLVAGCNDGTTVVWTTDPIAPPRLPPAVETAGPAGPVPTIATTATVALGAAGMWAPLGTVSDLITLTGPAARGGSPQLHDPRLRPLAEHPGVARLRELGWPAPARAGLAALLYADHPHLDDYTPPEGSTPREQAAALTDALRSSPRDDAPAPVDIGALTTAADAVAAATLALCEIIGPDAATLDPLLLLRLAHHVDQLPPLTAAGRALLSAARSSSDLRISRSNGTSTARGPGHAGIVRNGPLTTLLPTQLALPEPLFGLRYAMGELLHRHHPAVTRPPVRPVTIILDTTPPTYGPYESVLRLLAHLLATTHWRYGHDPVLITLTDPHTCTELSQPRDLIPIWTSRTLHRASLATALDTATGHTGRPTVTLTTDASTNDHPSPSSEHQLVTAHPAGRSRGRPARPYHHHLDPDADPRALTAVLDTLLAAH